MIDQEENGLMKPDYLLSNPVIGRAGGHGNVNLERTTCSYKNHSERFLLKEKNYTRQYAHIYAVRLMEMRKRAAVAARRKWGG